MKGVGCGGSGMWRGWDVEGVGCGGGEDVKVVGCEDGGM